MKFRLPIVLIPLALVCGILLSQASWVGRTGINFVYRQYGFLNSWWKATLVVLAVWALLYGLQQLKPLRGNTKNAMVYYIVSALLCLAGWAYAWYDFHNTASHRWLGAKFHFGAYLFFAGWLLILIDGWVRHRKENNQHATERRITGV